MAHNGTMELGVFGWHMHGMSRSKEQEEKEVVVCSESPRFLVGFEDHVCGEPEGENMRNTSEAYDEEEEDDDLVNTYRN